MVALVSVVSGETYEHYAEQLFESVQKYMRPVPEMVMLEGRSGWPDATMYRWHILLENLPRAKYVYLIDADMRCEQRIGSEILPANGMGITATQHPGFVDQPIRSLPYERRKESACYVQPRDGERYYCGGFVGGERLAMRILGTRITRYIDRDVDAGITPLWHDESALNRALVDYPPTTVLPASFCFPDDASGYPWLDGVGRKIVAVDKSPAERAGR